MSAKIILAGINIACLAITLLYPNSATPFALLPVIVTSASWVFSRPCVRYRLRYLSCATIIGAICIILGSTAEITKLNPGQKFYEVIFNSEVALFPSFSFNYIWFALYVFDVITALILGELLFMYSDSGSGFGHNTRCQGISIESVFRDRLYTAGSINRGKKCKRG